MTIPASIAALTLRPSAPDPRHVRAGQTCPVCGDNQTEHGHGFPPPPAARWLRPTFAPVRSRWQRMAREAGRALSLYRERMDYANACARRGMRADDTRAMLSALDPLRAYTESHRAARWWARWLPWWPA